jgi:hypothetical protein
MVDPLPALSLRTRRIHLDDTSAAALPTGLCARPQSGLGGAPLNFILRLCKAFASRRERRVAAVLLAELSRLSDAELHRRGIARHDLVPYCTLSPSQEDRDRGNGRSDRA